MNRRNFLRDLVGGVAATAAVRTWPFRVYSIPAIVRPTLEHFHLHGITRILNRGALTINQMRAAIDLAPLPDVGVGAMYWKPSPSADAPFIHIGTVKDVSLSYEEKADLLASMYDEMQKPFTASFRVEHMWGFETIEVPA